MEQQRTCRLLRSLLLLLFHLPCVALFFCSGSAEAYKNHTVGDSLGWYDKLQKPTVNYQKWAAAKTFSLGDFLIFNTDSNHSVVQSYNFTTYNSCDNTDSQEKDTTEWLTADPSALSPQPATVAVPLMKEGMCYFFSGYYDGEQCRNGQQLKINVTHGQGLPPRLKSSSNASPGPVSPDLANEDSAPDTVVSSDFNHPKKGDAGDDDEIKQESGSMSTFSGDLQNVMLLMVLVLFLSCFG